MGWVAPTRTLVLPSPAIDSPTKTLSSTATAAAADAAAAAVAAHVEPLQLHQPLQAPGANATGQSSRDKETQGNDEESGLATDSLQQQQHSVPSLSLVGRPSALPASGVVVMSGDGTRLQRSFWLLCAFLSLAMGVYALQYCGLELFVPANIAANKYKTGWLVLHATAAACALFLGPAQFVPSLRRRRPTLHRYMGRAYAFACCTAGGAALPLAVGASTGAVSAVGFFLLGLSWIGTTLIGVVQARRGLISSHRRWMLRSFALSLSALTLRIYIPIGIRITGGEFDPAYRLIAWICWLPNLIAAEAYIRTATK